MAEFLSDDEVAGVGVFDPRSIDRDTGAPVGVRVTVGSARTARDKLATLQKFYPDARPYGEDNYLFTDPETGRLTLYNEEGVDLGLFNAPTLGDLASIGGETAEGVGGTLGAIGGGVGVGALTGGVGAIPGAIAGGAGGAATGREAFDWFARNVLGTEDTRTLGEHLTDTAITAGTGALSEFGGQALAKGGKALLGGLKGEAAQNLAQFERAGVQPTPAMLSDSMVGAENALERMPFAQNNVLGAQEQATAQVGEAAKRNAAQMAEIAARERAAVEAAEAAGKTGPGPMVAERADRILTSGPGSTPATQAAQDAVSKLTAGGNAAALTGSEAGAVLQRGAADAGERFAAKRNAMDDQLLAMVGRDRPVRIDSAVTLYQELSRELAKAPEALAGKLGPARNELAGLLRDAARNTKTMDLAKLPKDPADWPAQAWNRLAAEGKIPYDVLRNVRTKIGTTLEAPDATGMFAPGKSGVMDAYMSLKDDIVQAADSVSPKAGQLQRELDDFTHSFRGGDKSSLANQLTRITDMETPEQAWKAVKSWATDDPTKFQRLVGQLQKHERDELAGAILNDLGTALPGQQNAAGTAFSAEKYLTDWAKLKKGTKDMLFGDARHAELRRSMDDLAAVTERIRKAGKLRNRSNTGNVTSWGALLKGLGGSIGGLGGVGAVGGAALPGAVAGAVTGLAGIGALKGAGMAWTSPKFIRALVKYANTPVKENVTEAQALSRFARQLAAQDWVGDPAEEYVHQLGQSLRDSPEPQ